MSAAAPSLRPVLPLPSQDGVRLIVAGFAYLLGVCLLQLVAVVGSLMSLPRAPPSNLIDVRDVLALFGWVGLTISGVGVIIVPNHLRVHVRPRQLPTVHLLLANFGLVGFLAASWWSFGGPISEGFLGIVSASFFLFGLGVLRATVPFLRRGSRSLGAGTWSGPRPE